MENYHSDMTRVLCFEEAPVELETIYLIVREAQEKAFKQCRPGTPINELDKAARGWIEKKGYGKFFTHGLGHGVGLEIHELPVLRQTEQEEEVLKEGMVITIEPGIYLPGKGGVRLEDTIAITENGFENLTMRPLESRLPIVGEQ